MLKAILVNKENEILLDLGVFETEKEMIYTISKTIEKTLEIESYYWRQFFNDDGYTWIDFGNKTKFFKYVAI